MIEAVTIRIRYLAALLVCAIAGHDWATYQSAAFDIRECERCKRQVWSA